MNEHAIILGIWIAAALYGLWIQGLCLKYARKNMRVGAPFGAFSGIYIMAKARLRSNWVRMSVVTVNLAIGLLALAQPNPAPATLFGAVVSILFVVNEFGMLTVATVEALGIRRLRKTSDTYRVG